MIYDFGFMIYDLPPGRWILDTVYDLLASRLLDYCSDEENKS